MKTPKTTTPVKAPDPTAKQQRVFEAIVKAWGAGNVPTMRTIARDVGLISNSTAYAHVKALKEQGRLRVVELHGSIAYVPLGVDVSCPLCNCKNIHTQLSAEAPASARS